MKVTLNLAAPRSSSERYGLAWAVPLLILGLVGLVFLGFSTAQGFKEYRHAQVDRKQINKQEAKLEKTRRNLHLALEQPGFQGVFREARFVNTLIEKKRVSLTELTAKLTKLLPSSALLTSLALSQQENRRIVRVAVTGNTEDAVEGFLDNLESSSDFADVAILHQGFEQQGSAGKQLVIICTARYVGGEKP